MCHAPSIFRCVWMEWSPTRMRRCFPRLTTSSTTWPDRSTVAYRGTRTSHLVSTLPSRASRSELAVRQTVSPSGISGPQPETARRGRESGLGQDRSEVAAVDGVAVDLLDHDLVDAAAFDDPGEGDGRGAENPGVVGEREHRATAPFDEQDQFALDEHHQSAGLAPGPVRGCVVTAFRPGERRT